MSTTTTHGVSKRLLSPSHRHRPLLKARDSPIRTTSLRIPPQTTLPSPTAPFYPLRQHSSRDLTIPLCAPDHPPRMSNPSHCTALQPISPFLYTSTHPISLHHKPTPQVQAKPPAQPLPHYGGIDPSPTSATRRASQTSHAGLKRHGPRATGSVCKATTPQRRMMHGR